MRQHDQAKSIIFQGPKFIKQNLDGINVKIKSLFGSN